MTLKRQLRVLTIALEGGKPLIRWRCNKYVSYVWLRFQAERPTCDSRCR